MSTIAGTLFVSIFGMPSQPNTRVGLPRKDGPTKLMALIPSPLGRSNALHLGAWDNDSMSQGPLGVFVCASSSAERKPDSSKVSVIGSKVPLQAPPRLTKRAWLGKTIVSLGQHIGISG